MVVKPIQGREPSSEPWIGHILKGIWGRKTHTDEGFCVRSWIKSYGK